MNWIFTPAYCKAKMLEQGLAHIYSEPKNMDGFKHVVIDQHYPVNKQENREKIKKLCDTYGCIYIDSLYDRGLHEGVNNAMRIVSVKPGDTFIGCDPDDRPSHGAFHALKRVMDADPSIAVLALNFWVIPWKIKDHGLVMHEDTIAGERVWIHPGVEMFNIASTNTKFLLEMGGFTQPNAYYGGIELALFREWVKRGMRFMYLVDHSAEAIPVNREDPELYDKSYGEWKIDHAHKGYGRSYEEWLKDKGVK